MSMTVDYYICVYVGRMRRNIGADVRTITDIGSIFNWLLQPYGLIPKSINVDGRKLTADLQVDVENGLDVVLDFDDVDSFIKLEDDINVTLFSDGPEWRTAFHPVFKGEPVEATEIFSDSL